MVNFHYCMNKLASTQLFAAASGICGKCGMDTETSRGCCRDEMKVFKLEEDQQIAAFIQFSFHAPVIQTPLISDYYQSFVADELTEGHFHNHSPPLISEQDTYLQNGVFRI